jgi:hypothetical protein
MCCDRSETAPSYSPPAEQDEPFSLTDDSPDENGHGSACSLPQIMRSAFLPKFQGPPSLLTAAQFAEQSSVERRFGLAMGLSSLRGRFVLHASRNP